MVHISAQRAKTANIINSTVKTSVIPNLNGPSSLLLLAARALLLICPCPERRHYVMVVAIIDTTSRQGQTVSSALWSKTFTNTKKWRNTTSIVNNTVVIHLGVLRIEVPWSPCVSMETAVASSHKFFMTFEIRTFDLRKMQCPNRQERQETFDIIIAVS